MRLQGKRLIKQAHWGAALIALTVSACGGGGGVQSIPAPTPTPTGTPDPTTPDPIATPSPAPTPTPSPTPAGSFDTSEYRRSDGPSFHNAISAWQQGATGQGVTIAIVDSGIDSDSPEFTGRLSSSSADVAGSRGVDSDDFHGNTVALIAAGARNNTGILGMAWQAQVMALRADTPGSCATSDGCSFSSSAITTGIDRAINNGAKVINLSLGGSDPGPNLRAAITRAAQAGVVVIDAAGNGENGVGLANPDDFALAIRGAGNGNVIIAGSVNGTGAISAFSNRAGSESGWYLAALGEGICCVYENGAIKTSTSGGQTFVTVVSGTSFSAPQISGAAALLRQAFPNLTATQVVDLLLRTARDAGATGTDAVYGRGLMDLANAFAPQGSTSIAGTGQQVSMGTSGATTSPAMGDAIQGASLRTVVLDAYQRAYNFDLSGGLRGASVAPRLSPALGTRSVATQAGPVSIAYSLDARVRPNGSLWNGQLRLGPQDAEGARVLAARVAARISPSTSLAFAYAQGADGLAAQVRGARGTAFLIAGSPLDDTGFVRQDQLSFALRRQVGPWGLTLTAEGGKIAEGDDLRALTRRLEGREQNTATRFGLSFDRSWGPLDAMVSASWLAEGGTVLGARLDPSLGGGADTMFLDAAADWYPAEGWRIGAAWRQGHTRARRNGLVAAGSRMASNAWSFDVTREALFQDGDSLGLRFSQPLRVTSGGIGLMLPVEWDYASESARFGLSRLSLSPHGREVTTELAWRGALWNGAASASLFYRKDPGHYASLPDEQGLALTWSTGF